MDREFWLTELAGVATFLAAALTVYLGVYGVFHRFQMPHNKGISKFGFRAVLIVLGVIVLTAFASWRSTADAIDAEKQATAQTKELNNAKASIDQAIGDLDSANDALTALTAQTRALSDKLKRLQYPLVLKNLQIDFDLTYSDADARLPKLFQHLLAGKKTGSTFITWQEIIDTQDICHLGTPGHVWIAPIVDEDKESKSFLQDLHTAATQPASSVMQLDFNVLATLYDPSGGDLDMRAAHYGIIFTPQNKTIVFRIRSKGPHVAPNEGQFPSVLDISRPSSGDVAVIILVGANQAFTPPEIENISLREADTGEVLLQWDKPRRLPVHLPYQAAYVFFASEADKRFGFASGE
jgi:hypothetical protein